jgi:hypothetical protein
MDHLLRAITFATMVFLGVSCAAAQVHVTCFPQRGAENCPEYTAPAATAVPGPSMDGGVGAIMSGGSSYTLFGGKVPPNGFLIRTFQQSGTVCFVNDNGAAGIGLGFYILPDAGSTISATFATPLGYKPIGSVNISCFSEGNPTGITSIAARGW